MGSPEVKRPGLEPDNSPPSNFKIKNEWSYTYISACFYGVCGDNFTFMVATLLRTRQDLASVLKA
jgi:hypothetical protein